MGRMTKGKVCYIPVREINKIAPEIDTSDFTDIDQLYDVCEEHLLTQGFILFDDPIEFIAEVTVNRYHELRYNCIIVKGTRRNDKFIINEVGTRFIHIK